MGPFPKQLVSARPLMNFDLKVKHLGLTQVIQSSSVNFA